MQCVRNFNLLNFSLQIEMLAISYSKTIRIIMFLLVASKLKLHPHFAYSMLFEHVINQQRKAHGQWTKRRKYNPMSKQIRAPINLMKISISFHTNEIPNITYAYRTIH